MSDTITIIVDGAEAHVLEAALALYRGSLDKARVLGGPALDAVALMDPIAARFQSRLHDAIYGPDEPVEPDWSLGDHFVFPAGVGR